MWSYNSSVHKAVMSSASLAWRENLPNLWALKWTEVTRCDLIFFLPPWCNIPDSAEGFHGCRLQLDVRFMQGSVSTAGTAQPERLKASTRADPLCYERAQSSIASPFACQKNKQSALAFIRSYWHVWWSDHLGKK